MCVSPYRRSIDPDGQFLRAWEEAYGIPADHKPEPEPESDPLPGLDGEQ